MHGMTYQGLGSFKVGSLEARSGRLGEGRRSSGRRGGDAGGVFTLQATSAGGGGIVIAAVFRGGRELAWCFGVFSVGLAW